MSEIRSSTRIAPLFQQLRSQQTAATAPVGTGGSIPGDTAQFSPVGGAGNDQEYSQFVADTIAMLSSPDPRQRFQAIVNATKMQPAEAVPILERAAQNDNAQVVELANRALTVMKQMPAGQAPSAQPQTPAAQTPPAQAPAAQQPQLPGAQSPAAQPQTPAAQTPAAQPQGQQPAAIPTALPPLPAAPTGQKRELWEVYNDIQQGTPDQALRAILELGGHAQSNRQQVLAILLNQIPSQGFQPSAQTMAAAISVLREMKATEAVPYLQALTTSALTDTGVKNAAQQTISELKGGQPQAQGAPQRQLWEVYNDIEKGTPDKAMRAMLELGGHAQSNRQQVLAILLNKIPSQGFQPSAQTMAAAISVLREMKATEAVPYLQALTTSALTDTGVKNAAKQAIAELKGGASAPVQQPAQQAAQPAQQPAQQPSGQGSTIPGFLR